MAADDNDQTTGAGRGTADRAYSDSQNATNLTISDVALADPDFAFPVDASPLWTASDAAVLQNIHYGNDFVFDIAWSPAPTSEAQVAFNVDANDTQAPLTNVDFLETDLIQQHGVSVPLGDQTLDVNSDLVISGSLDISGAPVSFEGSLFALPDINIEELGGLDFNPVAGEALNGLADVFLNARALEELEETPGEDVPAEQAAQLGEVPPADTTDPTSAPDAPPEPDVQPGPDIQTQPDLQPEPDPQPEPESQPDPIDEPDPITQPTTPDVTDPTPVVNSGPTASNVDLVCDQRRHGLHDLGS